MKRIVALALIVTMMLALSITAMAAKKEKVEEETLELVDEIISDLVMTDDGYTITDKYPNVEVNSGKGENGNKNASAELDANLDFLVTILGDSGNPDGWFIGVEVDEANIDSNVTLDHVTIKGSYFKGSNWLFDFVWEWDGTGKSGFTKIDSEKVNDANKLVVTEVIAKYTNKTEEPAPKEKTNNGRAHGNNKNFGEPTGIWHKDDEAKGDGYAHPGGKDGEGNEKNNGKVDNGEKGNGNGNGNGKVKDVPAADPKPAPEPDPEPVAAD